MDGSSAALCGNIVDVHGYTHILTCSASLFYCRRALLIFSRRDKKRKLEGKEKNWEKNKKMHKQRKTIGSKCRIVSPFKCKACDPPPNLRSALLDTLKNECFSITKMLNSKKNV